MSATSTDAAGNVSAAQSSSAPKDTVAPAAPSASYVDNSGTAADQITGTAEANASISIGGTGSYGGSANGSGGFTINVAAVHGTNGHPINVSYSVTATDAAGNTSAAANVSQSDTK
jgi:hypothetical protein